MSLRKLWRWRLRSRSHLRPVILMVCCFMALLLLLNRTLVVDRAVPEDLTNTFSNGRQTLPSSPLTAQPNHPAPSIQSSSSEPGNIASFPETAVESVEESTKNEPRVFLGTYKDGLEDINRENDNSYKSLRGSIRENRKTSREKNFRLPTINGYKNEPSFGFINEDASRRSRPQEGNQLMDVVKGFFKGKNAVNPGMLLGAVAALKGARSFTDAEGSSLKSVMELARAVKQTIFVEQKKEGSLPDSQDFLKPEFKSREPENDFPETESQRNMPLNEKEMRDNEAKSIKDASFNKKNSSKPSRNFPQEKAFRPTTMKGAMTSLFEQGLIGKSSSQDAISTVLTLLVPHLLSRTFSNDESVARPNPDASNSSPFHSLVSGLGPILAGIIQQGFGKENPGSENALNSAKTNPFQSIMSQMGPSLLAGAVQAGLGFGKSDKRSIAEVSGSNPLRSVLSGLGSVLMANQAQGGRNPKKGSKEGLERLKERPNDRRKVSKNSSVSNESNSVERLLDGKKSSGLPETPAPQRGGIRGIGGRVGDQGKDSGFSGLDTLITSMDPLSMSRTSKARQVMDTGSVNGRTKSYQQNSTREDPPKAPNDVTVSEEKGGVAHLLTRAILQGLLPEELPVPEANSTRGAWDMAVNLVFGNPKDGEGKKSQFWKWLREHGGGTEGAESHAPNWITGALENPQRASYANEIMRLYGLLESREPICKNVKYVGGVYNWKTNVLDGAQAVCMDADITPKRENCLVYSFGIKEKWSFEEEMEKMGCEVWAFDPAVKLGNHNHTAHVHFYSLGLAASNTTRKVDQQVWNLFTFSTVIRNLGHETKPIDYLKLDIHGDEWKVLQEVMLNSRHALTNVRQLGVEVHLQQALHHPSLYKEYLETLQGLESFGFQLFVSKESQKQEKKYEDPVLRKKVSLSYDLAFLRI